MKSYLIVLLIGFIAGAGVAWYFVGKRSEPTPTTTAQSPVEKTFQDVKKTVSEKADSLRTAIDAKLDIWHLKAEEIKEELAAKGKVVRRQTREIAAEVKDATLDARITTEIKGK